jgi:DNA-binding CsgD family transcriptional regulator
MMGIKSEAMVEQYNYCNRGKLDSIPDISTSGKLTSEFFDCGKRSKCQGEGLVCKMTFGQIKITPRELECLRLNSKGKSYAEIRCEMGFNSQNSVNSLMSRLRDKMGAGSKSALIIASNQLGIF